MSMNLSEGLFTNAKLFADDTSLFCVFHDSQTSANKDLEMIHNWALEWKMNCNPDPVKQAQEIIFSRKTKKLHHLPIMFNNANVTQSMYQNHQSSILDSKLTIENHLKMVTTKISKTIVNYKKPITKNCLNNDS